MELLEKNAVLVLADISGYTRFMVQNQTAAVHSQMCINLIIETLIREIDIPLVLQELEGDAVFFYAAHDGDENRWQQVLTDVGAKLERFFAAFIRTLVGSSEASPCPCAFCRDSKRLRLKLIVHSGQAIFSTVAGRKLISGVDVILAHRLLTNSVPGDEYLLMTEAAFRDIGAGMQGSFAPQEETYPEIGHVKTYVRFQTDTQLAIRDAFYARPALSVATGAWRYATWGVWEQVRAAYLLAKASRSPVERLSRYGFTLLLIVSTPVSMLLLAVFAQIKLLAQRRTYQPVTTPKPRG